MNRKPKVFLRNILGFSSSGLFFAVLIFSQNSWAANPAEEAQKAIVTAFEKSSVPLFEDKSKQPKPQTDPFLDKIRKERNKFYHEDQKRQRDFVEKLRSSNWPEEKKQQKIADFHKKQLERRQKFGEKIQKKIEKHQEQS